MDGIPNFVYCSVVSDIAIFVLKRDVKLQLTNCTAVCYVTVITLLIKKVGVAHPIFFLGGSGPPPPPLPPVVAPCNPVSLFMTSLFLLRIPYLLTLSTRHSHQP